MAFTTLTFGDFDPVTGPPVLDGLTAIPETGMVTNEVELGYVQGGRITYGTSSGFPPVVIDAVRDGAFLQLGFFCRFDLSFDIADTIVVALKPTPGSGATTARRIDIHPVLDGTGAAGPAADDVIPGVDPARKIRTNRPAAELDHFTMAGGAWASYAPENVSVRARSWRPPVAPAAATVGDQNLPGSGGTLTVNSTGSFAAAGVFEVAGKIVTYTAKTATTFTGCETIAPGPVDGGSPVFIPEAGWSAELRIPVKNDGANSGGAGWINLAGNFGLFISVIRAGVTAASGPDAVGGQFAAQHVFPTSSAKLSGTLDETLVIPTYGTGAIPAQGGTAALGVGILNGELGIGARAASAAPFTAPTNTIDTNHDNVFVTQVENSDPANPAAGVTSEVRIANWGMPPAGFAAWSRPPGASPNPSDPQNVANGTSVELTTSWPAAVIPDEYDTHFHQCIWVQLSSGSPVNFTSSSDRRNMDFAPLSSAERDAEISGVGYPTPPNGLSHEFVLVENTRMVVPTRRPDPEPGPDFEAVPVPGLTAGRVARTDGVPDPLAHLVSGEEETTIFIYIVHGYRITGETLTIGERTFRLVDGDPGAFGFISEHKGTGDVLTTKLSGPALKRHGNFHILDVPHNGTTTIRTRVEAAPPKPGRPHPVPGPIEDDIREIHRLHRRLWKLVHRLIMRILRKLRGK